jgi:hypothetical protein
MRRSPAAWLHVLSAAFFLVLAQIAVVLPSRVFLNRATDAALRDESGYEEDRHRARILSRRMRKVMRHWPLQALCLQRSLALHWLLRSYGVRSRVRIGTRLRDGSLDAHAWVEVCGVPMNERPDISAIFQMFDVESGQTPSGFTFSEVIR